jgi:hypothetical protein
MGGGGVFIARDPVEKIGPCSSRSSVIEPDAQQRQQLIAVHGLAM